MFARIAAGGLLPDPFALRGIGRTAIILALFRLLQFLSTSRSTWQSMPAFQQRLGRLLRRSVDDRSTERRLFRHRSRLIFSSRWTSPLWQISQMQSPPWLGGFTRSGTFLMVVQRL